MKAVICGLLGLSLLAAISAPADAGSGARKHRTAKPHSRSQSYRQVRPRDDYHEHIADKLPFGSSLWWEQMNRERRGGRSG
jgi:hypothetical protein